MFVDDRGLLTTVGYTAYHFDDGQVGGGTEIYRWDSNFNLVWTNIIFGYRTQYRHQVVVDTLGNTYVTASFDGTVSFTPESHDDDFTSRSSTYSTFVSAYDDYGDWKWATLLSASGNVEGAQIALALDSAGRIFTTGKFQGVADIGPIQAASGGESDAFVAHLDPADGTIVAAWHFGGNSRDFPGSIATDSAGNVFAHLRTSSFVGQFPTGEPLAPGEYIVRFRAPSTAPYQEGDANRDGQVDRMDVAILATHLGMFQGATRAQGDVNDDGRVSLYDLAIVQQHLSPDTAASGVAAAPSASALIAGTGGRRLAGHWLVQRQRLIAERVMSTTRRTFTTTPVAAPPLTRALRALPRRTATVDRAVAETPSWRERSGISSRARRVAHVSLAAAQCDEVLPTSDGAAAPCKRFRAFRRA